MAQSAGDPDGGKAVGVAAGDQAETSGISMIEPSSTGQRAGSSQLLKSQGSGEARDERTSRRDVLPPLLRPVARGGAPTLAGTSRPGFEPETDSTLPLDMPGQPLTRRTRRIQDRLGRRVAGSTFVHALLVLLSVLYAQQKEGGKPQEQAPVEMLYDRPGSAGMAGPSSPDNAGTPPSKAAKPAPELQPPAPLPPVEPPPVPETVPSPQMEVPEPLPKPQEQPTPPVPLRPQAQSKARSSPFSHPMDLSFSQPPTPRRARRGRAAGSGAAVDLSVGPLVQGGHLLTPYASATSIKGVSDDYGDEISAWIRRHMYYPEEAAKQGQDGPSHVHVVLDRQGKVKSVRLVDSSGSYLLDAATTGMFDNAQLPPVPPDMSGNSFDVDLTIDYILIRK